MGSGSRGSSRFGGAAFAQAPEAPCGAQRCDVESGSYRILLPAGVPAGDRIGAILFFHGYGGSADEVVSDAALASVAQRLGVALIAPDGIGHSWSFPGSPARNRDEFAFTEQVLADVTRGFQSIRGGSWPAASRRADRWSGLSPAECRSASRPSRPSPAISGSPCRKAAPCAPRPSSMSTASPTGRSRSQGGRCGGRAARRSVQRVRRAGARRLHRGLGGRDPQRRPAGGSRLPARPRLQRAGPARTLRPRRRACRRGGLGRAGLAQRDAARSRRPAAPADEAEHHVSVNR